VKRKNLMSSAALVLAATLLLSGCVPSSGGRTAEDVCTSTQVIKYDNCMKAGDKSWQTCWAEAEQLYRDCMGRYGIKVKPAKMPASPPPRPTPKGGRDTQPASIRDVHASPTPTPTPQKEPDKN
jgi:hypothetical protein